MRNKLIHGYDTVDLEILWDTVSNELPELIEALEQGDRRCNRLMSGPGGRSAIRRRSSSSRQGLIRFDASERISFKGGRSCQELARFNAAVARRWRSRVCRGCKRLYTEGSCGAAFTCWLESPALVRPPCGADSR